MKNVIKTVLFIVSFTFLFLFFILPPPAERYLFIPYVILAAIASISIPILVYKTWQKFK